MNLSKQSERLSKIVDTIANNIEANKNKPRHTYKFTFNTKNLPDRLTVDKNNYSIKGFESLFKDLDKKKNHCLYWFEINQENKRHVLLNMLNNYRAKKERTVPASATKKAYCENSHIFYVGVRRGHPNPNSNQQHSNICRRIYQHLGYYHTAKTQGLQLSEYANKTAIDITLYVVEFKNLNYTFLNNIEKAVASKLKPLCGRH